ncbi:uncharacterized protein BO97DRAFT_421059 [Aspergillus homomorphus CBS 101889]|uniref:Uncharacterized protein n=1 Tax=Aspergillus homomorphus (strain CBS 101889) TaxID=1450537 RepID=A0A395I9R5_ASPHC|nr:hypothetical protein BO97DRAFT_421059 [Aspergillus homomorphus CBS 101889]RAL15808.1 hypothetical protein BO97DRAFT_421059 [Aspergillus homomorphus CBS 101889]
MVDTTHEQICLRDPSLACNAADVITNSPIDVAVGPTINRPLPCSGQGTRSLLLVGMGPPGLDLRASRQFSGSWLSFRDPFTTSPRIHVVLECARAWLTAAAILIGIQSTRSYRIPAYSCGPIRRGKLAIIRLGRSNVSDRRLLPKGHRDGAMRGLATT